MKYILSCLLWFLTASGLAQTKGKLTVNFDFNKYDLNAAAAARLDSFFSALPAKAEGLTIELYGHCDSIGSNSYNDALSLQRVDAVKGYLANKGIGPTAIARGEGLGKRQPLNGNLSYQERALNRRVEMLYSWTEPVVVVEKKLPEPPVEIPVEKTITKTIEDTATKVGTKIALKNLNFVGGLHNLMPESMPVLHELLKVMQDNPRLVIAIEGHVCCLPTKADGVDLALGTQNLSEMRAKTVYDYLLLSGIAADRISYKGFGHRYPLTPYPEMTEQEKINNRRVEIRIVSK